MQASSPGRFVLKDYTLASVAPLVDQGFLIACSHSGNAIPVGSPAPLIISASTARTRVRHIYAKLDGHNRARALERACSLQLL